MKNKLIVVTGATKGIGRAIAEKFAGENFDIVVCARNREDLNLMKEKFKQDFPAVTVYVMQADMARKDQVIEFGNFVNDLGREVSILVNNAGYFLPGQISNEPDGTLESMVQTNVFGAYHLTRCLLPAMMKHKKGYIFNMGSTASITPYVNGGSYCISKFALLGFSKVLREEMKAFGVKVTTILPGATLTDSWEGTDLPTARFIKPGDVADIIYHTYTLSPNSVVEEILVRPQLGDI